MMMSPDEMKRLVKYSVRTVVNDPRCLDDRGQLGQQIRRAIEEQDWEEVLWLLPRADRFPFFYFALRFVLSDADYSRLLGEVWRGDAWRDSSQCGVFQNRWVELFTDPQLIRESLMSPEELARYQELPDSIKIWRGAEHPRYARGLSWTPDLARAAWSASGLCEPSARIFTPTVDRAAVLAYFETGNEIVVDPRLLGPVRPLRCTPAELATAASRFKLGQNNANNESGA